MLVDLVSDSDSDVTTFDPNEDDEDVPLEYIKLAKQRNLSSSVSAIVSSLCPGAELVENDPYSAHDVSLNHDHEIVQISSDNGVCETQDSSQADDEDEESGVASSSGEGPDEFDVSFLANLSTLSRLSKRDTLQTFQEDDDLSQSLKCGEDIRREADELSQALNLKDCMTPKSFLRTLGHCPISPFLPVNSEIETVTDKNVTTPETKLGFKKQRRQRSPQKSTQKLTPRISTHGSTPQRCTPQISTPRRSTPRQSTPRKATPQILAALRVTPQSSPLQKPIQAAPILRRSWPKPLRKSTELTGPKFSAPSFLSQKPKHSECQTPMIPKSTFDNMMTKYFKLEKKFQKVKKKRKLELKQLTLQNFEGRKGDGPITRDQRIATLSETVCTIFKNRASFPQIGFTEMERQLRNPMDELEKEAIRNEIRSRKRDCDCLCFCKDDLADEALDDTRVQQIPSMPPLTFEPLNLFTKTV